tara:strand:- start:1760 stop:1987 length:228 start_codon:yes stop_codon:yes gene_type:complete
MITQENKDQLRFLNRFNQSKAHNVYSKKNISGQTALSNLLTIPNLVKILIDAIGFSLFIIGVYFFMYAIGGNFYA